MSDWTAGYVADVGYTFGIYAELNPQRLKLAFLMAGLMPPPNGTACELGFGQGMSANIHAAASVTEWHGTDFNPSQAAFARELAAASGANLHLNDQSFAEFCSRSDLPDFDFIGLHGIFSWISDENRHVIVDFVRRKLKVGGVLYISYNTQPGWAGMAPVRELLTEHANVMGAAGSGSLARVEQSFDFVSRLFATNPMFVRANPNAQARFEKAKEQNRAYLAHEYFNRDWVPIGFANMARWLEPAKVTYACSAHYLDHIDAVNLTAEQQKLVAEIADPHFAQTVRDFIVNQTFRRDYWVRGARRLSALEQDERLQACRVTLLTSRERVSLKTTGSLGEVTLQESVYGPVLDMLADQGFHTLGDLIARGACDHGLSKPQVVQAIFILAGSGKLAVLQDDDVIARATPQAQKLNLHLCTLARSSTDFHEFALPATGGSVTVDRFQQLFTLARSQGSDSVEGWAAFAASVLARQGQRLLVDGKPAESDEVQLRELTRRAVQYRDEGLPMLRKLGAVA
ncbi:methyltransferase regulatory domain-containing protein [Pseudoduganella umbonata]|uniref:Methyltransferase n=1 Tax=Pseudoduganella umbonata TaxID=864828 RepID=A0A4P8HPX8_9BURK|nr:methyltransferase regulatory domain-containing protein [Pseudoduganella umbonata]MBB3221209.1 SAM-dependent methyltransferase [Pseudoduganella umbonata]QCP10395.1 methyltransferase [Pseudoduganella umbonata]